MIDYEVCAGTAALQCDLAPLTPYQPGLDGTNYTSHQFELDTPLVHNQTVCVSVEGVNEVGLRSDRLASDCVVVDGTPPGCEHLGMGLHLRYHTAQAPYTNVLFGNVVGSEDLSALEAVEWCASSEYNGTCDIVPLTTVPMQFWGEKRGSKLYGAYLGVGGLSLPGGSNVSIGARMSASACPANL